MSRRAVCAPNAFKGCLTAAAAAAAMARGVRDAGWEAVEVPIADGGDGTLDVLVAASTHGRFTEHLVTGPLGRRVRARLGWLARDFAVVEMAEASGLRRVSGRLDPMRATSRGTGELIAIAIAAGASRVLVGVGGSASTDGGAGLLQALGSRLIDPLGHDIGPGGAGLERIERIELALPHPRPGGRAIQLQVAVDVDNPLAGPFGAASVFAPQKGASASQVRRLDAALARFAAVAERDTGLAGLDVIPGAGAAGGCGFALAVVGAALVPGAALVCELVGLDRALARAGAVLTGEGRLDSQTARGKGPAEVARLALGKGVECVAIVGAVAGNPEGMFEQVYSLTELAARRHLDPLRHSRRLLRRAARIAVEGIR